MGIKAQPAIMRSQKPFIEKVRVISVVKFISSIPEKNRTILLNMIARRVKLSQNIAELLILRSLGRELILGTIDEVSGTIQVSGLQSLNIETPSLISTKNIIENSKEDFKNLHDILN